MFFHINMHHIQQHIHYWKVQCIKCISLRLFVLAYDLETSFPQWYLKSAKTQTIYVCSTIYLNCGECVGVCLSATCIYVTFPSGHTFFFLNRF